MSIKICIFLCGLIYLAVIPAAGTVMAAGDETPAGSYQKSCKNAALTSHHILSAECRAKDGKFINSRLPFVFLCAGDISNQNGVLSCQRSAETTQFKTAVEAFSAASLLVLGSNLYVLPLENIDNVKGSGEFAAYLGEIFERGDGQQYRDGVTLPQAIVILKAQLPKRGERGARDIVNAAYKKVFKRGPKPEEYDRWIPPILKKAEWFATIAGKLRQESGQ